MNMTSIPDDTPIIVVSGLPRSGTSLMMQMLLAGGVPVLADGHRPADASNPRGYFEYERVKWLAADSSWLNDARGKAVKVIVQLVPFLPRDGRYQFIFMHRPMPEIIRSQTDMLEALGKSPGAESAALERVFGEHYAAARAFANQLPLSESIEIGFAELISSRGADADRIIRFLNRPYLDSTAMIEAIDPALYRSRS